jgi:hypothetical protein
MSGEGPLAQIALETLAKVYRLDRESRAQEQGGVELVVTTRRLHFFDPATGRAIYDGDGGQS